ncbi:MAG: hypothetical protein NZ772_18185, partial [Cyanobacteria bacterium]|nr:hypothetical protein [Cyanobacteriota bacterium]MDW8203212.1 hypothetical protein [Cyanobacteriota bacterium SKYGB_h_bin112]
MKRRYVYIGIVVFLIISIVRGLTACLPKEPSSYITTNFISRNRWNYGVGRTDTSIQTAHGSRIESIQLHIGTYRYLRTSVFLEVGRGRFTIELLDAETQPTTTVTAL